MNTKIVIAIKETGEIWGGVWGDPASNFNQGKLESIRQQTGKPYEIMTFKEATK